MDTKKQAICQALRAWINQRPGLEPANYFSSGNHAENLRNYRAEVRSIGKDLQHARELLRAVELRDSITGDDLESAFPHAYSGRLSIQYCHHDERARATCGKCHFAWCAECAPSPASLCHKCNGNGAAHLRPGCARLDYCTGQYFPTEYRKAACAVLASALWNWQRDNMPKADLIKANGDGPVCEVYPGAVSAGDWLRASFRRQFGRSITNRWFN